MLPSAYDLKEYYNTPQGQGVAALLTRRFAAWWPDAALNVDVMIGSGYALPYLETCRGPKGLFALLSGDMGGMHWPGHDSGGGAPQRIALADRGVWPLPGSGIDYILMIHDLEYAEDPAAVLDEAWRALKPEGRLILVVPNRTGFWSRAEKTPFGHGRPFTQGQLHSLLRDQNFALERMTGALLAPPTRNITFTQTIAPLLEKMAPLATPLCGVIVAEATKRLYAPIRGKAKAAVKPAMAWSGGTAPAATPKSFGRFCLPKPPLGG